MVSQLRQWNLFQGVLYSPLLFEISGNHREAVQALKQNDKMFTDPFSQDGFITQAVEFVPGGGFVTAPFHQLSGNNLEATMAVAGAVFGMKSGKVIVITAKEFTKQLGTNVALRTGANGLKQIRSEFQKEEIQYTQSNSHLKPCYQGDIPQTSTEIHYCAIGHLLKPNLRPNYVCGQCYFQLGKEGYSCEFCLQFDICYLCSNGIQDLEKQINKKGVFCQQGHYMFYTSRELRQCDGCGFNHNEPYLWTSCYYCNYDLCQICVAKL